MILAIIISADQITREKIKSLLNSCSNSIFRIHKSHMVNIKKLKYFDKADGGFVVMSDDTRVPVASIKREAVIELFESIG